MNNREIADLLETVAQLLSIRGDSIHRYLAYQRAAESIRELSPGLAEIAAAGKLTEIPHIGKTLAEKIEEMLATGRLQFFERLTEEIPASLVDLLRVEGLGPKRVKAIYEQLGVTTLEELAAAAREGRLSQLPGLGKKSEAKIMANIEALTRHGDDRLPLGDVWPIAERIVAGLRALPGVAQAEPAGSLRRYRETIGDLDLLVAADEAEPIMAWFRQMPDVESVVGSGPTKTRVVLRNGLGVDLRVLPPERWGTLLNYFTGSKDHNVRLRELARAKGFSLNDNSIKLLGDDGQPTGEEILVATEEEVYARLELPYIMPVLREDRGEIEAAQRGELPHLVQRSDIIADLHLHSTWSDGRASIQEMATAARDRGLAYIVVTDHSRSLGIANGLSIERLQQQAEEVRAVDEAMGPAFHLFHGTEMEIKADGSLDYPDEVLAALDFVIASLHVSLSQPRDQVTARALAAIRNPHVDMLGHPTGRLLPRRPGADLDLEAIFQAAQEQGTILEINANPQRLDLRDTHVRRAIDLGLNVAINTDAHATDQFDLLHYGIATACRGWATAKQVVNTWPVEKFRSFIQSR